MPGEQPLKPEEVNFKEKYRSLKRKMRFLIYEQECFQEELRRAQRKLLKISRDKNFLLDRLLQYERVIDPGTDSDSTLSSEDSCKETKKQEQEKKVVKKKRRPKKKPTKRLQGTAALGASRVPLPHDLHSPPQALHQQLPHLAELMRKAAEGLPITQTSAMLASGSTGHDHHQHHVRPHPHAHHHHHQQQHHQVPPLSSPHSLLSPHTHPALLSPSAGSLGLPLPPNSAGGGGAPPPGFDPRAFDRGLHQSFSLPAQLGGLGALGPMRGLGAGVGVGVRIGAGAGGDALPHMDLNALTAAAAQDKINQERNKKSKSRKDTSDKHHASHASQGPSQHRVPLPLPSTSSTHEENEDLVIDTPESKR